MNIYTMLFTESPLKLQEICSLKIAESLWKHVLLREKFEGCTWLRSGKHKQMGNLNNLFYNDLKNALDALKMPKPIAECIRESFEQVGKEMNDWKDHIKLKTTAAHKLTMFPSHLLCCTWNSNGTINYPESARKFISIANINKAQKFEIASHFCLEDVMIDLCEVPDADLLRLLRNFTKTVAFRVSPTLFYWLCKLTKQMAKLPMNGMTCTEFFMLVQHNVRYWWPIEYFWDRLSERYKVTVAIRLIQRDLSFLCEMRLKDLAVKMSESQLTRVLHYAPVNFIRKLMDDDDHTLAFSVWIHVKDWISGGQFVELVHHQRLDNWLVKMWDSADNHHKDAFLRKEYQNTNRIIGKFFYLGISVKKSCQFPISVLSYASADRRKELFMEYAYDVVQFGRSENYDCTRRIIQLCLPDASDTDIKEFDNALRKRTIRKRKPCERFLKLYFPKYYNME